MASEIATVLRGKHKPSFSPHVDGGDFVIVVNCDRIVVTGNKLDSKRYYRHSRYPGGLKSRTMREQMERLPDLGRAQMKKLRIYAGSEHPHAAQQPKELELQGEVK
jgi:large subunit ribosomal protein L13